MLAVAAPSSPLVPVSSVVPRAFATEAATSSRASSPRIAPPVIQWSPASSSSARSIPHASGVGRPFVTAPASAAAPSVITFGGASSPPYSPPLLASSVFAKTSSVATDLVATALPNAYSAAPLSPFLSAPMTYTAPTVVALGGGVQAPATSVATAASTISQQSPSSRNLSRPLAEFEFEKLQARTSAAQTVLANLEEDVQKLRLECQQSNEKRRSLKEALAESMPTGEHYQLLRAMSTEHLTKAHEWERREMEARSKQRKQYDETLQRLENSLNESEAQLKEFDQLGPELQRASAGQREYEEKSARYADQVYQLTSLQNLATERQAQVDNVQSQAVEVWKQLQAKLWEIDDLRAGCEAWKLQYHAIAGRSRPALFSPRATSPARQLFLAHLDAADHGNNTSNQQAHTSSARFSAGRISSTVSFSMASDRLAGGLEVTTAALPRESSNRAEQATKDTEAASSVRDSRESVATLLPISRPAVILEDAQSTSGIISRHSLGSSSSVLIAAAAKKEETPHAPLSGAVSGPLFPSLQKLRAPGEVAKSFLAANNPTTTAAATVAMPSLARSLRTV